jgi:hypothetical protein
MRHFQEDAFRSLVANIIWEMILGDLGVRLLLLEVLIPGTGIQCSRYITGAVLAKCVEVNSLIYSV